MRKFAGLEELFLSKSPDTPTSPCIRHKWEGRIFSKSHSYPQESGSLITSNLSCVHLLQCYRRTAKRIQLRQKGKCGRRRVVWGASITVTSLPKNTLFSNLLFFAKNESNGNPGSGRNTAIIWSWGKTFEWVTPPPTVLQRLLQSSPLCSNLYFFCFSFDLERLTCTEKLFFNCAGFETGWFKLLEGHCPLPSH